MSTLTPNGNLEPLVQLLAYLRDEEIGEPTRKSHGHSTQMRTSKAGAVWWNPMQPTAQP